jgi:hypothetical protein
MRPPDVEVDLVTETVIDLGIDRAVDSINGATSNSVCTSRFDLVVDSAPDPVMGPAVD